MCTDSDTKTYTEGILLYVNSYLNCRFGILFLFRESSEKCVCVFYVVPTLLKSLFTVS